MGKVLWNETQKPSSFAKSLDTCQANVVYQPAHAAAVTPATHKPHSTGGKRVLTFSLVLQISPVTPGLTEVSAMALAQRPSLLPLLPVMASKGFASGGL